MGFRNDDPSQIFSSRFDTLFSLLPCRFSEKTIAKMEMKMNMANENNVCQRTCVSDVDRLDERRR
jgi:hypothetical protein